MAQINMQLSEDRPSRDLGGPDHGGTDHAGPDHGGLVLSSVSEAELAQLPPEVALATMRHMMHTLFARVEALQQNQAVQFSGVNDRLDAVELEIPLIQEQSALRIRDLETRMTVEIEEAARSAAEEAAAGIHREVAGKFGSLTALIDSQRSELAQMRDSKRLVETNLSRVIHDVERLCGNLNSRSAVAERPVSINTLELEGVHRAAPETPASPIRSRIAEHIRKAALDAAPDDSNPLVGDPRLKTPMADPVAPPDPLAKMTDPLAKMTEPAAKLPEQPIRTQEPVVRSQLPIPPITPKPVSTAPAAQAQPVPGFADWKRQFMQDGDPLHPTLHPQSAGLGKQVICPRCYSERTRPATLLRIDTLVRLTGYSPHRCRACAHRFYKRGLPSPGAALDEDGAEGRTEEVLETR